MSIQPTGLGRIGGTNSSVCVPPPLYLYDKYDVYLERPSPESLGHYNGRMSRRKWETLLHTLGNRRNDAGGK